MSAAHRANARAGDWIAGSARRVPDRVCFHDEAAGVSHTFAETNRRVNQLAHAMREMGLAKGDRIALLATDSHRYMETLMASMKLGCVYVPLNYRLVEDELLILLDAARPSCLLLSARYAALIDRAPALGGKLVCFDGPLQGAFGYEDLIEGQDAAEPDVSVSDEDILGLMYTSGTTGRPKGVLQSQRMLKALMTSQVVNYGLRDDEVRYSAAPLFHTAGMTLAFLGVYLGFPTYLDTQFDAATLVRWLQAGELTTVFLVPTMIKTLLEQPGVGPGRFANLRLIQYGAAPMPPSLLERAIATFGCDFLQAFGPGTEAGMQTVLTAEDHRRAVRGAEHLLRSVGRPAVGVSLRIVDDDMRDVPIGQVGEVVGRSDTIMTGYLGMPHEDDKVFKDGWFRAGDLAWADEAGYLYLAGRSRDMIIRGGENIYPVEIEAVLTSHDAVREASVVSCPDEHWGEIVCAFIVAGPGGPAPREPELVEWCRARLARFKVPERWMFVDELAKNASGKVLKGPLRARLRAARSPA